MSTNEAMIRQLYTLAEGKTKDSARFASMFTDDGYLWNVSGGEKLYGKEIGNLVDGFASAFPDIHRELKEFYVTGDVVVVELSLNGTHKGDFPVPGGRIPPTGKEIHAPCCDVFHLENGKVKSFHCYLAVPILLQQLGVG